MTTSIFRPTSGSGSNWSNIANAYDNNKSTNASVSASRFNHSNRSATFTFDFSSIPEGSTINKVRVYLRYNVGKTTVAAWVYLTANDQVSFVPSSTSILEEYNEVDGNSYTLDQLSSLKITPYNSNFGNNTLNVYEFWLEIDYTEPTTPTSTLNIKLGATTINNICIGNTKVTKVYIGNTLIFEN